MSRGVVANQTGPYHRAVGVDDPPARRPDRAVVRLGVGDLFAAVQDTGPPSHARLGQTRRP